VILTKNRKKAFKLDRALIPIYDPIYSKEIQQKIDSLFIYKRFYFYKAKDPLEAEEGETNESEEQKEIERLIQDCMIARRCYLDEGRLETIHHQKTEREIIVD
jgi:hypothetical protein